MKLFKKTYWLIFPTVLFICLFILDVVFNVENSFIRTLVAGFVAYILSPRKKKFTTQTGEKTQITWFFLKKPIFLD